MDAVIQQTDKSMQKTGKGQEDTHRKREGERETHLRLQRYSSDPTTGAKNAAKKFFKTSDHRPEALLSSMDTPNSIKRKIVAARCK